MNESIHFSRIQTTYETYRRFYHCSPSERILYTAFLLAIGIGYLVALANMYYTYEGVDGVPGITIEDIAVKYHGSDNKTRLSIAINGVMEPNLKNKADKALILQWIANGATEPEYRTTIAPILNRDCVTCHTPAVSPSLPDLTQYKTTAELAQGGGGVSLPTLLRIAHIHLFGISFVLVFIGKIFLLCEMNTIAKRIIVGLPFLAMVLDIGSWFATRMNPDFAYVVVGFGALMGFSIALQIVLSIYQMWFSPSYKNVKTRFNPAFE